MDGSAGKLAKTAALFIGQQVLIQSLCIIGFIVGFNAAGGKVEVGYTTVDKDGKRVERVKAFHPWSLTPQSGNEPVTTENGKTSAERRLGH